jgi:hypothetical protein
VGRDNNVALHPVLKWGSAEIARRFADDVVAAVAARYPLEIAAAMGAVAPVMTARLVR